MKILRITTGHPQARLASASRPMLSSREADNAERVRLYHSARWQRARRRFLQEHPLCIECEQRGLLVEAIVVDHKYGHRHTSWRARFWDEQAWQGLCVDCHNRKSARELAEWKRSGGDMGS